MYSWRATRRVLIVLLLFPLLHFAWHVRTDMRQASNPDPNVWEDEVAAFEAADAQQHPPRHPLLVLGGRQASIWNSLEQTLFPIPIVNRGIGDANLNDIQHHLPRLVGHHTPLAVLVVPGATDLAVRDNKNAGQFMRATAELCARLLALPSRPDCYVMSLPKWPLFPETWERIDQTNERLSAWAAANPHAVLIDTRSVLHTNTGDIVGTYFRNDGHNLNDWGIERVEALVRAQFERDFPLYF